MQVGAGNMMFKETYFPLSYDQRYQLFRQIIWNYSLAFLKPEDYKRISLPKKIAGSVAGVWGCGLIGLQYLYSTNPETFFRRFLFTPLSPIYFAALPLCVTFLYLRSQSRIYKEMYDKYVGKLTDVELLELDGRFHKNKQIVYKYIIDRNAERMRKKEEEEAAKKE